MFGGKGEYFTNYQSVSKSFTLKPDMAMSIFLTYVFVQDCCCGPPQKNFTNVAKIIAKMEMVKNLLSQHEGTTHRLTSKKNLHWASGGGVGGGGWAKNCMFGYNVIFK